MHERLGMEKSNEKTNGTSKEDEALTEDLDFSKPNFEFIPKGSHEWRQQGYYLICKSCDLEHAVWIGSEKLMVGVKDSGQPILKDRT